jgi:hypothetical protein
MRARCARLMVPRPLQLPPTAPSSEIADVASLFQLREREFTVCGMAKALTREAKRVFTAKRFKAASPARMR